ncbi:hypothetical protein MMC25_002049 [Agyrium rufum]|nr:hypothetical protein [Agyrium rufum]
MKRQEKGSISPPAKRRLESTTTQKAVSSFFTPVSKKEPESTTWRVIKDSLLIGHYEPKVEKTTSKSNGTNTRSKIAAFDFDSTLIQTSSGNVFGRDAADWKWWDASVPSTLRKLWDDGYIIAIVSNQGGINLNDPKSLKADKRRMQQFKDKVTNVFNTLDIPITLYAATTRDIFRKPRTGMWTELLEDHDLDLDHTDSKPDLQRSFFVGDAAGRLPQSGVRGGKGDHSCSDRDFAANIGIDFHTPEEFFLKEEPQPFIRSFDPRVHLVQTEEEATIPLKSVFAKTNDLDIVLFIGSPASGKSTFYSKFLRSLGYERVNQDTLKTRDRCLRTASDFLDAGKAVAVDNTNADPGTRKLWIQLAQKKGVPTRYVHFTAPPKLCEHNDTFRALAPNQEANPEKRTILPHSAFSGFAARYREPRPDEGFQDIITIPFEVRSDPSRNALQIMEQSKEIC